MKMILYLDFDGVIWDTWPKFYEFQDLKIPHIKKKTDNKEELNDQEKEELNAFFREIDWDILVFETKQLDNSFEKILLLIESKLYDVKVLTHCNTQIELDHKKRIIKENIGDIEVIGVFKGTSKADAVDPRGNILVDDFPFNVMEWIDKGGIGIRFSSKPKNDDNYLQITSLEQLLDIEIILENRRIYERK